MSNDDDLENVGTLSLVRELIERLEDGDLWSNRTITIGYYRLGQTLFSIVCNGPVSIEDMQPTYTDCYIPPPWTRRSMEDDEE
jgi:hypothetical protein